MAGASAAALGAAVNTTALGDAVTTTARFIVDVACGAGTDDAVVGGSQPMDTACTVAPNAWDVACTAEAATPVAAAEGIESGWKLPAGMAFVAALQVRSISNL